METKNITPFLIDAEMLGYGFNGSLKDLGRLAEILAERCPDAPPIELRQHLRQDGSWYPTDYDWFSACDQFAQERPELFR